MGLAKISHKNTTTTRPSARVHRKTALRNSHSQRRPGSPCTQQTRSAGLQVQRFGTAVFTDISRRVSPNAGEADRLTVLLMPQTGPSRTQIPGQFFGNAAGSGSKVSDSPANRAGQDGQCSEDRR